MDCAEKYLWQSRNILKRTAAMASVCTLDMDHRPYSAHAEQLDVEHQRRTARNTRLAGVRALDKGIYYKVIRSGAPGGAQPVVRVVMKSRWIFRMRFMASPIISAFLSTALLRR